MPTLLIEAPERDLGVGRRYDLDHVEGVIAARDHILQDGVSDFGVLASDQCGGVHRTRGSRSEIMKRVHILGDRGQRHGLVGGEKVIAVGRYHSSALVRAGEDLAEDPPEIGGLSVIDEQVPRHHVHDVADVELSVLARVDDRPESADSDSCGIVPRFATMEHSNADLEHCRRIRRLVDDLAELG